MWKNGWRAGRGLDQALALLVPAPADHQPPQKRRLVRKVCGPVPQTGRLPTLKCVSRNAHQLGKLNLDANAVVVAQSGSIRVETTKKLRCS